MSTKEIMLTEQYAVKGWWWPAGDPEDKCPGELQFDPGHGLHLELMGAFESFEGEPIESREALTIIGRAVDGRPITLLRCFGTSQKGLTCVGGLESCRFFAHAALIEGRARGDQEHDHFETCRFRLLDLEDWLGDLPFKIEDGHQDGVRTLQATYLQPADIRIALKPVEAELRILSTPSFSIGDRRELPLSRISAVVIDPMTPRSLDWYLSQINCVRDLFSFLMGGPNVITRVTMYGKNEQFAQGVDVPRETHLLYEPIAQPSVVKPRDFGDMLVRRTEVEECFSDIVSQWVESYDEFGWPLRLFLTQQLSRHEYREPEFLLAAIALEGWSRRAKPSKRVSDEQYSKIKSALIASIPHGVPSDLRDSLISRIEHGNERSLAHRLLEMIRSLPTDAQRMIDDNPRTFAREAADMRNDVAHLLEKGRPSVDRGERLLELTAKLELLFTFVVFNHLHVPSAEWRAAAHRSRRFALLRPSWGTAKP